MCTNSTDEKAFQDPDVLEHYTQILQPLFGFVSIWKWGAESGILPCPVYCRHCVLATQAPGVPEAVHHSFLDDTYLCDRKTTLRKHLQSNPHVMDSQPPESLVGRYSG
eukprot:GGOE01022400.1.p2 GENE.GGOE01022400.1~~GGOE01022400.1.p2  ORF type:complete len:108 (+),score=24.20 GGOE01022400.1:491-814(+)